MSAHEACELLQSLMEVDPEDLDSIEHALINAMREPVRQYLVGTLRHQGHLPGSLSDLVEMMEIEVACISRKR